MIDWALLLAALIAVESGGDTTAIGDNGKAVGCLQIHPAMVVECNRILELKRSEYRFENIDRTFESTSRSMAIIYLRWYCDSTYHSALGIGKYEFCARIWNGGPNGYLKDETDAYWQKVQIAMDETRRGLK